MKLSNNYAVFRDGWKAIEPPIPESDHDLGAEIESAGYVRTSKIGVDDGASAEFFEWVPCVGDEQAAPPYPFVALWCPTGSRVVTLWFSDPECLTRFLADAATIASANRG